jgi:hypothetical protein
MTIKMACLVLEEYRDFSHPLTKYGRDVLLGYSKTINVTMANAPYIDESNTGTIGNGKSFGYFPSASIVSSSSSSSKKQQQQRRPSSSAGYQEEVMKNRPVGATSVCYICAGNIIIIIITITKIYIIMMIMIIISIIL